MTTPQGMLNTDREIYRSPTDSMYDDSIHVTEGGSIGLNVSGHVIVKPLREWHQLAAQGREAMHLEIKLAKDQLHGVVRYLHSDDDKHSARAKSSTDSIIDKL